jgi:hypothetical protein
MFHEFITAQQDRLIDNADYMLELLTDKDLLYELAHRDLEKLARIFNMFYLKRLHEFDKGNTPTLQAILDYLGGGDND